jgi:hypothetical protein
LYFSVAVWLSIALVNAPARWAAPGAGAPARAGRGLRPDAVM